MRRNRKFRETSEYVSWIEYQHILRCVKKYGNPGEDARTMSKVRSHHSTTPRTRTVTSHPDHRKKSPQDCRYDRELNPAAGRKASGSGYIALKDLKLRLVAQIISWKKGEQKQLRGFSK